MPRQARFSKEDIVAAGLRIVKTSGFGALSARSLGKELGTSSSPVFTVFADMDEVLDAIRLAAKNKFLAKMEGVTDYFPAFKEFGLRLVDFAKEDPNLFHLLFFSSNSCTKIAEDVARECLQSGRQGYGLNDEQAETLFRQMWPVACGLAALCVMHPEDYPEDFVSSSLSFHFAGLISIIKSGRKTEDIKTRIL